MAQTRMQTRLVEKKMSDVEMSKNNFDTMQKEELESPGDIFEHVGPEIGLQSVPGEIRTWSLWRGAIAECFGMTLFLVRKPHITNGVMITNPRITFSCSSLCHVCVFLDENSFLRLERCPPLRSIQQRMVSLT